MSSNKKYIDFGIKWGLIMGGTIAVIRNIIWVFDKDAAMGGGSNIIWWISLIAFIIFLSVIGIKARSLTGFITFKQGFTALFFAILVHGILNFAVSETLTLMNEDEITEKINEKREEMIEKWEESGMSDEQIETSLGWFDRFSNPSKALIFYFIAGLIINTLIALIIAAIIKRTPPQEIPQEPETT
jgi:hypothetical protein